MVRRVLIPLVVAAAAIFAVARVAILPLRCNRVLKVMRVRNDDASRMDDYAATLLVRKNLTDAADCLQREPCDPYVLFEIAQSYRRMGSHEEGIRTMERALRYDRRPEFFIALGDSLAQTGRTDEAIDALMNAARFWGRDTDRVMLEMRDVALRDIVMERRRAELAKP